MRKEWEYLLDGVQKPARYTGGELGSVVKDKTQVKVRYAFCFPDSYEIGMSHLGMKILYGLVNARGRLVRARVRPVGRYGRKDARERRAALCA